MNIFIKKFKSNAGMGLAGILIAASIGLVLVAGISKTMVHFADQVARGVHDQTIGHIFDNVRAAISHPFAWQASSEILNTAIPGCFPSYQRTAPALACPYSLYYNEANPSSYPITGTGAGYSDNVANGGLLKQWICGHSPDGGTTQDYGEGLITIDGRIIYPEDIGGGAHTCCSDVQTAGVSLATCLEALDTSLVGTYVRVRISHNLTDFSGGSPPNFVINIDDFTGIIGKRARYTERLYDHALTPGGYTEGYTESACSVALGHGSSASGSCSIAIGENAVASGNSSIAIGRSITSSRNDLIRVGDANSSIVVSNPQNEGVTTGTTGWNAANMLYAASIVGNTVHEMGVDTVGTGDDNTIAVPPDYVFDYYFDGEIKGFDKKLVSDFEIMKLTDMIKFIERKYHLPTLSSEAEWNSEMNGAINVGKLLRQLWITAEVQATYIIDIYRDLEALELKEIELFNSYNKLQGEKVLLEGRSSDLYLRYEQLRLIKDRLTLVYKNMEALLKKIELKSKNQI